MSVADQMKALLSSNPSIETFESECDRILANATMRDLTAVAVLLNGITTELTMNLMEGLDARHE